MAKNVKKSVLLVNLGSPLSPTEEDVRPYLREFLMDEHVIDYPYWLRWLVVHVFILPRRPARSAKAYHRIWWEEGSPLIVISQRQQARLQEQLEYPVALGMRYGSPSIKDGLVKLVEQGVEEILLVPLYPHYAYSTTVTVEKATQEAVAAYAPNLNLKVLPSFHDHPMYIQALVASAQEHLDWDYDHILFSYHGVPERQLHRTDSTGSHCLKVENCCHEDSPAHATCYRHQAFRTVALFIERAGVPAEKYSVAFQSRLGPDAWLRPYTDERIAELAQGGVKKLLVITPSFVTDCLETLEEIAIKGKETFLANGGEEFRLAPCLNTHPMWIETVADWCRQALVD